VNGWRVPCNPKLHAAAIGETVLTPDGEYRTGSDTSAPWGFTPHRATCGRAPCGEAMAAADVHAACAAIKERLRAATEG